MANLSESFGKRIKELRKSQGLTQEQLGERAELHSTYVGAIERGEQNPSLETVEKLASGFGVDLKLLFDFRETKRKPQNTASSKKDLIRLVQGRREPELELGLTVLKDVFEWAKELRKSVKGK